MVNDVVKRRARQEVWITLSTGQKFYPWAPEARKIDLRDIAHTLSQINRWGGHTREPYSVAQHAVMVSLRLPEAKQAWGLLHDATEAYMGGDIVSPIKRQIPELMAMEAGIAEAITARFGFPKGALEDPEVKHADMTMLALEYRDLMPQTFGGDGVLYTPEPMASYMALLGQGDLIVPWGAKEAESAFLFAAHNLGLYPHA